MARGVYDRIRHAVRYSLLRRLPPCRDLVPVMSESLDRRLGPREWLTLRLHMLACVWCDWYIRELVEVRQRCRAAAEPARESVELAAAARERIRRAIQSTEN